MSDGALGKRERIVRRVARELRDGDYVNLGIGLPTLVANFVLIRCRARPASEVFRRLYEEHGILVRDVSGSAELAECLRISIGTEEDMEAVLEALSQIVAKEAR